MSQLSEAFAKLEAHMSSLPSLLADLKDVLSVAEVLAPANPVVEALAAVESVANSVDNSLNPVPEVHAGN